MDESVRQAVARAIMVMRENLGERLTVDDLARAAMFSKFHFTRVFLRATGLSPGRFLAALRLAEAKRLLTSSAVSVADISHQVGYNSVGTFSARFSASIGISPSGYRQLGRRPPQVTDRTDLAGTGATIRGQVWCPATAEAGPVFVGLFPARIAEGAPARHVVLDRPGPYVLTDVPLGSWYVLAHSFATPLNSEDGRRPYLGLAGPATVHRGITGNITDVLLRPRHGFDPPLLLALPDLRPARRAIAV